MITTPQRIDQLKLCISCGVIFCFSFLLSSCRKESPEQQKVNDVIYKLIQADNQSDIETVLSVYTDSIEFYPAGKEFIKGLKNVRKSYETLFSENKLTIRTQILETTVFNKDAIVTGINTGTKTFTMDSSITELSDKYIALLKRLPNGEWKINKLIWGIYSD